MSSTSAKKRKKYSSADVDEALSKVESGEISQAEAVHNYGIMQLKLPININRKKLTPS